MPIPTNVNLAIFPFTMGISVVAVGSKKLTLQLPSGVQKDYAVLVPFMLSQQGISELYDHLEDYRLMHDYLDIQNSQIYAIHLTGTIYSDRPDDTYDFIVEKCHAKFLASTPMNTVPTSEDIVQVLISDTSTNIVLDLDWDDIHDKMNSYAKLLTARRGYKDIFVYPSVFDTAFTSLAFEIKSIGELKDTGNVSTRELYIPESPLPAEESIPEIDITEEEQSQIT